MVVAMGHTGDDYEVWTHRDDAHAYAGYRKRRRHVHRVDASFRPCFLELLQASGCAHYVEVQVQVRVQEAWYS